MTGERRDVHRCGVSASCLVESEGLLPHLVLFFWWTPSFLRSETALQGLFQGGDEVGRAEGTTSVGVSAKRFNFLRGARRVQILTPSSRGPGLPPELHIQRRVGVVVAAVRRGARPG